MAASDVGAIEAEFAEAASGQAEADEVVLTFVSSDGELIEVALDQANARAVNRATLPPAMEGTLHAE